MAGLFDIIQYEVQVSENGHWRVRKRFPRSERERAFTEARRIDLNDALPARVVRDVYDPQSGRSQEITMFISDRAKALASRPAAPPPRGKHGAARGAHKTLHMRINERPAPLAFRATMALGVGLVTALLITSIATWMTAAQPESFASVLARTPTPGTSMTLFVGVMLFSVFVMLRGPLGISRLARAIGTMTGGTLTGHNESTPLEYAPTPLPARIAPVQMSAQDQDEHLLSLTRVMLARFFTEAAPANTAKATEDTLGRRGLALYLAGAASELAAHLEMPSPGNLLAQISPAPLQAATKDMLAEARDLGIADAGLMAAGRSGMQKYLSVTEDRPSMAAALVAWHKAVRAELQMPPVLREAAAS